MNAVAGVSPRKQFCYPSGEGSPGPVGYLVAFGIAAVAVHLPLALLLGLAGLSEGPVAGISLFGSVLLIGTFYAVVYGGPAGVLGTVVVHFALLRVGAQGWHVAAFGVTGVAIGWVYDRLLFEGTYPWLPVSLGVATAIGRAVVIPMARRRAP